jgi:hypothetical protein
VRSAADQAAQAPLSRPSPAAWPWRRGAGRARVLVRRARPGVDHAERADRVAVGGAHGRAGDGVGAEGDVARVLVAVAQADAGLDPLAVGADQADRGHRRAEQARGQVGQAAHRLMGRHPAPDA